MNNRNGNIGVAIKIGRRLFVRRLGAFASGVFGVSMISELMPNEAYGQSATNSASNRAVTVSTSEAADEVTSTADDFNAKTDESSATVTITPKSGWTLETPSGAQTVNPVPGEVDYKAYKGSGATEEVVEGTVFVKTGACTHSGDCGKYGERCGFNNGEECTGWGAGTGCGSCLQADGCPAGLTRGGWWEACCLCDGGNDDDGEKFRYVDCCGTSVQDGAGEPCEGCSGGGGCPHSARCAGGSWCSVNGNGPGGLPICTMATGPHGGCKVSTHTKPHGI